MTAEYLILIYIYSVIKIQIAHERWTNIRQGRHCHPANNLWQHRSVTIFVANIQEEDSKEQLWITVNHLFNNRGSGLSHTTDTA